MPATPNTQENYESQRQSRITNPSYTVPSQDDPAGDIADFTYGYDTEDHEEIASRIHGNSWRWPPSEVKDNAYLEVPERYDQERLFSDPDEYDAIQSSYEPGPDPKWNPRKPNRPVWTPSMYRFFRPFQKDVAERFTGEHFSMAAHSRNYPIYGMEPWDDRRNTYRAMPPPRDISIQDRGPDVEPDTPVATHVSPQTGFPFFSGSQRSWRA